MSCQELSDLYLTTTLTVPTFHVYKQQQNNNNYTRTSHPTTQPSHLQQQCPQQTTKPTASSTLPKQKTTSLNNSTCPTPNTPAHPIKGELSSPIPLHPILVCSSLTDFLLLDSCTNTPKCNSKLPRLLLDEDLPTPRMDRMIWLRFRLSRVAGQWVRWVRSMVSVV